MIIRYDPTTSLSTNVHEFLSTNVHELKELIPAGHYRVLHWLAPAGAASYQIGSVVKHDEDHWNHVDLDSVKIGLAWPGGAWYWHWDGG